MKIRKISLFAVLFLLLLTGFVHAEDDKADDTKALNGVAEENKTGESTGLAEVSDQEAAPGKSDQPDPVPSCPGKTEVGMKCPKCHEKHAVDTTDTGSPKSEKCNMHGDCPKNKSCPKCHRMTSDGDDHITWDKVSDGCGKKSLCRHGGGEDDNRVLFSGAVDHGGFGGPKFSIAFLDGDAEPMMGGYGAWLIDHTYFIGGGGSGILTDAVSPQAMETEFSYGGFLLGFFIMPKRLVHGSFSLLLGGGELKEKNPLKDATPAKDTFFIVDPELAVVVNILHFMRISLGIDYRLIFGIANNALGKESDFSGLGTSISAIFGKF